jgi:NAD(P)H-dependent flavin oxidoreductase YrpB (nitropropane dioxygenase family)
MAMLSRRPNANSCSHWATHYVTEEAPTQEEEYKAAYRIVAASRVAAIKSCTGKPIRKVA